MPKTLYICYFGLREPLVQTQVIPYLLEIIKDGVEVTLLTFEPDLKHKWTPEQIAAEQETLADKGIDWRCLAYHKRFSVIATTYDILRGTWFVQRALRHQTIDILHGRVHISTLMGALGRRLSGKRPRLLFDIRGFFPEEYTDAGVWPEGGWLYRSAKRVERWLMKEADGFVVLTNKARDILFPESRESGFDKHGRPVQVIPCCVDLARFGDGADRSAVRERLGVTDRYVVAYTGSFGGWYLSSEMMDFFESARLFQPTTFVLILTQRGKKNIGDKLRARGFKDCDFLVESVNPTEVSDYLNASDLALSFIKVCYSKLASSPTKIAEYLACGLPIVSIRGVGDVDEIIEGNQVGSIADDTRQEDYLEALRAIRELGETSQRCRETAEREFDLARVGGSRYRGLYQSLLEPAKARRHPAPSKSATISPSAPRTLYICYFGLREPLVQTQVIPYLLEIIKDGVEATLLTFEPDLKQKWTQEQINAEREKLAEKGIKWVCLAYHKRPSALATTYDVFRGAWLIRRMIGREKIDVLHGRVHIPTLMGAIARRLSRRKPKLLFDIRGFFPEEYTDAGVWPENGWLYRSAKRVERWLMKEADGFVVLTENAREILFSESKATGFDREGRPVEVIPCCVDFRTRFSADRVESRNQYRKSMNIEARLVITHLGALGGLYRTNEIADFLAAAKTREPLTFALFLTQTDQNHIIPLLKERGFSETDFFVGKVAPSDVQGYLNASDVGLSFVKAGYATASRSPTKIPEYLACGLPIIANRGVGDVDELIEKNKVGLLLDDFSDDAYIAAIEGIEKSLVFGDRCRETAHAEFDLEKVGGVRYRRLYSRLLMRKAD